MLWLSQLQLQHSMKKFLYALLLATTALGASSCRDEDNLPFPKTEEFPLIFTTVSAQSTFKLADVQGNSNPTATFDIELKGGDLGKIEAVQVYKTFVGFNVPATTTPPTAPTLGAGGPVVLLTTVPPNSGSVQVALNDLIPGLTRATGANQGGARIALTRASLRASEGFRFTYALLLKDGRQITYNATALSAPFSGVVTIIP